PNLQPLNKALLYRYIGDSIKTTIRRNMYCSVAGDKFMLPSPEVLERLQDEQVTAYYIANGDGKITEAYIYQDDRFITKVEPVVRYNESRAEQTQEDIEAFEAQVKYAARFRSIIKRNKIRKVGIMPNIDPDPEIEVVSPTIQEITTPATDVIDYRQLAQQNL
ncbi:MAG: hypothetical protein K2F53_04010, partial [Rikenellaceae bacterium]|nr:hypothetical protein [Rikenellaceae bacterium]